MRKVISTVFFFCILSSVSAQYCYNSGPSVCTPAVGLTTPGFSPDYNTLSPLINGQVSGTVIEFTNYTTILNPVTGTPATMDSLQIDSIGNLPEGLCWATNKRTNTFGTGETGCIKLSGTTCATPGQYSLFILVTVWTTPALLGFNPTGPIPASALGVYYYVRVNNVGEATVAVDTAGEDAGTLPAIEPYGPGANCSVANLTVSLGSNQTVCPNTSVNLTANISNGASPYTYAWSYVGSPLNCNTCTSPNATITQTSTYTVTVTDNNHQTASATVNYTLATSGCSGNSLAVSLGANQTVCPNTAITLGANITNGQSPYSYAWSYAGSPLNCNTCTSPTATVTQASTYTVTVTDNNHQTASATVNYTLATSGCSGNPLTVSLGGNQTVCPNTPITLTSSISNGQSPYSYAWSYVGSPLNCNSCTNPTATITQVSTYTVTVTDNNHQTASATVTYTLTSEGTVQINVNGSTTLCSGQSTVLSAAQNGLLYSWSNGGTTASIVVSQQATYTVTVTNNSGCISTGTIFISVTPSPTPQSITGNPSVSPFVAYPYLVNSVSGITYAWVVEGGVIQSGQGTNSISVVWGATPPYQVTLVQTNTADCTDTSNLPVHLNTGLSNITENNAWQLYPNPAHDYLMLSNNSLADVAGYSIKVVNTLGQTVYTQPLKQHETQIEVAGWSAAGVYFVSVFDTNQNIIAVKKIVLQ